MTVHERTDRRMNGKHLFLTEAAVELYSERMEDPRLFPQEEKAVDQYFTDFRGSVLDVGCGVGRVSALLNERGFDVTGIDVSEPLVEKARSLFPELEFRVGDIRNTDFRSQSFDYIVFSFFGLDYILPKIERIAALREMYRLLKPAGILLFSTHNSWHPFVPLSLRDLGLGLKDIFDLYVREKNHGHYISRYKIERVTLGDVEIYLSNPIHQWIQLRKCGFTPIDVIGKNEGISRFFERHTHYVAKK